MGALPTAAHSVVDQRIGRTRVAPASCDRDPTDNDAANLAEACQRCHILHHKAERLRRERHSAQRAIGDPFTGPHR